MKILLICLLAVQIASVACTYRSRRHGKSSRNSASFLLRKVCVEVAGMKGKVAELEEEVTCLKEENLELKEKVAGLEEENSVIKQPVDGNWAGWMQWSGCSNNCGPGTRTRQRLCLDPRPSNGGSDCPESGSETENCEIMGCEVDGQWADWMQWSGCSNNCGPGTRTRQRLCLDPRPSNGGSNCSGSALETENCETTGCEAGFYGPTCMTSTCTDCSNTGEITLDLTAGDVQGTLTNATVDPLAVATSGAAASVDCNYRARVKVTFEPETATSCTNLLKIDMTFGANRSQHLFDLGDSQTNDGYAGDAGNQSRDAEIHGVSGHVIAYQCGHGSCNSAEIERKTGAVGSATSAATFWLAHNYYRLKTDTLDHELCDECLFDLNNGADDEGTMNRDLYLSFNRVNSGKADRNGYGVCFVKLSWVCNVA